MLSWEGKEQVKVYLKKLFNNNQRFMRIGIYRTEKSTFENKSIDNMIFVGDNLKCMMFLLKNGFEEKFDMIYIDPPFFTEKRFTVKKKF